jgi:hypothetical protein
MVVISSSELSTTYEIHHSYQEQAEGLALRCPATGFHVGKRDHTVLIPTGRILKDKRLKKIFLPPLS